MKFIIGGGVCAVLHGAPITTFDLYMVYSQKPHNLNCLINALIGLVELQVKGIKIEIDPFCCPRCFGKMKVISVIEDE